MSGWLEISLFKTSASLLAEWSDCHAPRPLPCPFVCPALSQQLAPRLKMRDYLGNHSFIAGGADIAIAAKRRQALDRFANHFPQQHLRTIVWDTHIRERCPCSDSSTPVTRSFPLHSLCWNSSISARLWRHPMVSCCKDLGGNWSLNLTGCYGVNVASYDQYKEWMERGRNASRIWSRVEAPASDRRENIAMLSWISKPGEVSCHRSRQGRNPPGSA